MLMAADQLDFNFNEKKIILTLIQLSDPLDLKRRKRKQFLYNPIS